MADLSPYGVAFIGVGGVVVGSLLTGWQSRRSSAGNWQRDERHKAYAQHLANAHAAWQAMAEHFHRTYVLPFSPDEQRDTAPLEVQAPKHTLSMSAAMVQLVGPKDVGDLAEELATAAASLMDFIADADQVLRLREAGQDLGAASAATSFIATSEAYEAAARAVLDDMTMTWWQRTRRRPPSGDS